MSRSQAPSCGDHPVALYVDLDTRCDIKQWLDQHCIDDYYISMPYGRDFVYIWHFVSQHDAVLFCLTWADYITAI